MSDLKFNSDDKDLSTFDEGIEKIVTIYLEKKEKESTSDDSTQSLIDIAELYNQLATAILASIEQAENILDRQSISPKLKGEINERIFELEKMLKNTNIKKEEAEESKKSRLASEDDTQPLDFFNGESTGLDSPVHAPPRLESPVHAPPRLESPVGERPRLESPVHAPPRLESPVGERPAKIMRGNLTGGNPRGRKSRGRKSRGKKSLGRKSRGRKSRGRKSRGRKSRGRKSRGRR